MIDPKLDVWHQLVPARPSKELKVNASARSLLFMEYGPKGGVSAFIVPRESLRDLRAIIDAALAAPLD